MRKIKSLSLHVLTKNGRGMMYNYVGSKGKARGDKDGGNRAYSQGLFGCYSAGKFYYGFFYLMGYRKVE